MPDEPDPPRKVYGFKPREFERANAPRPETPTTHVPPSDSLPSPESEKKIDVRELIRTGAGAGSQLGTNKVGNRANDVHGILRDNLQRDIADGHYDLGTLDDSKRRRRIRNYWIAIAAINLPLGAFAYRVGHTNPLPFVGSIALMALLTSKLTWNTFFLRTHY